MIKTILAIAGCMALLPVILLAYVFISPFTYLIRKIVPQSRMARGY